MGLFDGIGNVANNPAVPAEQTQTAIGTSQPGIADQWRSWFQRPENAAALMQAGIALTQPLQLGQNMLGALNSSVGQGMEARDRVLQNQQDQQKLATDQQLAQDKLALDRQSTEADTAYKKKMGIAAMMNSGKRFGPKQYKPRDIAGAYQTELMKARGDVLQPFGDPNDPGWKAKFDAAWAMSQDFPGANPPASAVGGVPLPTTGVDPAPAGLQEKINAAKAAGHTGADLRALVEGQIAKDGLNPNVINSLNLN